MISTAMSADQVGTKFRMPSGTHLAPTPTYPARTNHEGPRLTISSCKTKYQQSTLLPWTGLTLSQPPSPPVPTNRTRHYQTGNLNASQDVVAVFRGSGTQARTHPSSHRKTGRGASEVSHEPAFSFPRPQVPGDKVGLVPPRMKRKGLGSVPRGPSGASVGDKVRLLSGWPRVPTIVTERSMTAPRDAVEPIDMALRQDDGLTRS